MIKKILEKNHVQVERTAIRVWGRNYLSPNQMKDKKIGELEKMMKV